MSWLRSTAVRRTARILAILAVALATVRLWPHEPLLANVPASTAVVDRNGKLLRLALASDEDLEEEAVEGEGELALPADLEVED